MWSADHSLRNADLEEEEIVDAPRNDGDASIPEQVKRPNPWRRMMMMMMMTTQGTTYRGQTRAARVTMF